MITTFFPIRRRWVGPLLILTPVGELDLDTATAVGAAITTALRRTRLVIVDLSAVSFLDCGAISALIAAAGQAERLGGRLQVAALPDHVHRLFTLFDLYTVLGGHHDVAAECRRCLQHLTSSHHQRLSIPA